MKDLIGISRPGVTYSWVCQQVIRRAIRLISKTWVYWETSHPSVALNDELLGLLRGLLGEVMRVILKIWREHDIRT